MKTLGEEYLGAPNAGTRKPEADRMLAERELAELWSLSPRTLQGWRLRGYGPPYVTMGRAVRYPAREAVAWAAARQHNTEQ